MRINCRIVALAKARLVQVVAMSSEYHLLPPCPRGSVAALWVRISVAAILCSSTGGTHFRFPPLHGRKASENERELPRLIGCSIAASGQPTAPHNGRKSFAGLGADL